MTAIKCISYSIRLQRWPNIGRNIRTPPGHLALIAPDAQPPFSRSRSRPCPLQIQGVGKLETGQDPTHSASALGARNLCHAHEV